MRAPILASATVLLVTAAPSQQQPSPTPELTLSQPWLRNLSSWQQHTRQPEGRPIDKSTRGVWPIGDGHVFTYLGLGRRANTMQGLTGPHYQTAEVNAPKGHWGELTIDLVEKGERVRLPQQSVARTRGINCVITRDARSDLALMTVNWATRGHDAIYRWVEIRNFGSEPRTLTLRATWERGKANGDKLTATYEPKGFEAELDLSLPGKAEGNTLFGEVTVPANTPVTAVIRLKTRRKGTNYRCPGAGADAAVQALDACATHWNKVLTDTATIASDDVKVADLVEDWKVLTLVQRSEPSGAVSPMVNYRGAWIRDNTGPLLALLRYNLFEQARQILDYVHDATIVTGRLNNHVPLDLDVSKADGLSKTVDWSKIEIPNGELPLWIILQHEWYFRATLDVEFLEKRWGFIRACFRAVSLDDKNTLPANGDETYLHGAFFSLFSDRVPDPAWLPADTPDRRARSFDISTMYVVASSAMGEMGEEVDSRAAGRQGRDASWVQARKAAYDEFHVKSLLKIEEAFWMPEYKRFAPFISPVTGQPHTAPYAPVNLLPQWIGLTYFTGEKNKENFKHSLMALWREGTRTGTTPTVGATVGHQQGLLLYAMADLDDRLRHNALNELLKLAEPAGEWAELYNAEGRPIAGYNKDWPNRCRPWESGVNIDAICFALNGIRYLTVPGWSRKDQRFKLRTPRNSRWLRMENLKHDGHHFDMLLDEVWAKDLANEKSGRPIRKLRFQLKYHSLSGRYTDNYVDTAINVGETVYVRYPTLLDPVQEKEVWPNDSAIWMPKESGAGGYAPKAPATSSAKTLVFATTASGGSISDAFVVDIGLPMTPEHFESLLLKDGKPRFERVVFDVAARGVNRATMKGKGFWQSSKVQDALRNYARGGGKVLEPYFLHSYSLAGPFPAKDADVLDTAKAMPADAKWKSVRPNEGRLDIAGALGETGRYLAYAAATVRSDRARECVLRLGSDDGVAVWLNGTKVLVRKRVRTLSVDSDQVLVRLKKGENELVFVVYNNGGRCGVVARFTDTSGVPLEGVRAVDR